MLGISGYKTKKSIKDAVKVGDAPFSPIETSFFGPEYHGDGTYAVVGPSPTQRVWFAKVTVINEQIVKVS